MPKRDQALDEIVFHTKRIKESKQTIEKAIMIAKEAGATWAEIGKALGVDPSWASEKYGKRIGLAANH